MAERRMAENHNIVTLTMNPVVNKSTEVARVLPDQKLRCAPPRFEPGSGSKVKTTEDRL